jgi:hypothetical protein
MEKAEDVHMWSCPSMSSAGDGKLMEREGQWLWSSAKPDKHSGAHALPGISMRLAKPSSLLKGTRIFRDAQEDGVNFFRSLTA